MRAALFCYVKGVGQGHIVIAYACVEELRKAPQELNQVTRRGER